MHAQKVILPVITLATSLEWRPEYNCGRYQIDMQHREMFRCTQQLIRSTLNGESRTLEYLDELIMLTIEHFRDEEAALEQSSYSELAAHRRIHAELLKRVLNFRDGVIHGTTTSQALIIFLTEDVIARHMLETDRRYFATIGRTSRQSLPTLGSSPQC